MAKKAKKSPSLGRRLTLLLVLIFVGVLSLGGSALYSVLYRSALIDLTDKGIIVMEMMSAIERYTSQEVSPELVERLDKEFLPEAIASYSVHEVFDNFQEGYNLRDFTDFSFRQAVLNPTNPQNQADSFESSIIDKFRDQNKTNPTSLSSEKTGFRTIDESSYFYIARPIKIQSVSCLRCHSTPEIAPRSIIDQYGDQNGFGWQLNEVVGAQLIHIPINKTFNDTFKRFTIVIIVFSASLIFVVFWLYSWIRRNVVSPINYMVATSERALDSGDPPEFKEFKRNKDEIWRLASVINLISSNLRQKTKRLELIGRRRVPRPHVSLEDDIERNGSMPPPSCSNTGVEDYWG